MFKKKKDEDYKGMDKEELEDDELEALEMEEEEEEKQEKKLKPKLRLQKEIKKEPEKEVTERYVAFNVPPRVGIMDSETNEIIAEGEFAVFQTLAKMMTTLERIENNLGSMTTE